MVRGLPRLEVIRVSMYHVLSLQVGADLYGQALTRVVVHHGECTQAPAVKQRIGDEIGAPHFVDCADLLLRLPQPRRAIAPRPFMP